MLNARWCSPAARGRSAAGSASPCQGEGRGFESRRPLGGAGSRVASRRVKDGSSVSRVPRDRGTPAAEWPSGLGKGLQSPVHGFDSRLRLAGSRAVSSAGERFPDTEEVTGSNPVRPTRQPMLLVGLRPTAPGSAVSSPGARAPGPPRFGLRSVVRVPSRYLHQLSQLRGQILTRGSDLLDALSSFCHQDSPGRGDRRQPPPTPCGRLGCWCADGVDRDCGRPVPLQRVRQGRYAMSSAAHGLCSSPASLSVR